jgi:hypothetical protein
MHLNVGDLVAVASEDGDELGIVIAACRSNEDAYCFSEHARTLASLREFSYYVLISGTGKIAGPYAAWCLRHLPVPTSSADHDHQG